MFWWTKAGCEPAVHTCSLEDELHPGLHQQKVAAGREGIVPSVLPLDPLAVQHPGLGTQQKDRELLKGVQRRAMRILRELQSQIDGVGGEKALGKPHCGLPVLERSL